MSRIRLILMSLFAVVAVSALASASASAIGHVGVCEEASVAGKGLWNNAECTEFGGSKEYETKEVTSGELKGTGGEAVLSGELAGAEVIITCAKGKTFGEVEAAGAGKGEATFEECAVGNAKEKFANCEVPNITVKTTSQVTEEENEAKEKELRVEFKPAGENSKKEKIFTEVVIKNKSEKICAEKGSFPVAGFAIALLPRVLALRYALLLDFSLADNHHLTLGGHPATLSTSITQYLLRASRSGSRFVPWHIYR
jgi:hypothetical protein